MNNELVITLNNLSINSGLTGFYLDGQVQGLSFPDIRTSSGVFSGRDGGFVGSQFYGMRYITLQGRAYSNDVTTTESLRAQLQDTLNSPAVVMRVLTYAGHSYLINCVVTKLDMPIDPSRNFAYFKIELLAPDPVIYDDTGGAGLVVTISRFVAGGFTWPIVWPLVWSAQTPPNDVNNGGTVYVEPIITLTNAATNPILTNLTTGKALKFTGLTTVAGDVIIIDMKQRTVTLNGGNITGFLASDSQWWGLIPGANQVSLVTGSGGDLVSGTVSWRSGVMGI